MRCRTWARVSLRQSPSSSIRSVMFAEADSPFGPSGGVTFRRLEEKRPGPPGQDVLRMDEFANVLSGKSALVIGGGGAGIGRAITRGLAAAGSVGGGQLAFVPAAPLHETADEDWDLMFDLNLRYVARAVRSVLRVFLAQGRGGTIVSVGSITGSAGSPMQAAYGAAKAGLASLARSVAAEYSREGIRMNLVTCGPIATPVAAAAGQAGAAEWIPMGRPGESREVAEAAVFLASPLSSYLTGQSLVLDGGATAVGPFPHATGRSVEVDDDPSTDIR